jgi:hypothetical protein
VVCFGLFFFFFFFFFFLVNKTRYGYNLFMTYRKEMYIMNRQER